jgi:anaerobic selenocysteine-containing dehydrogenase
MEAAKARGQRHVVIDPRRTDTAEGAELHLAIAPQSDVRLWNGLLAELIRRGAVDQAYIAAHVNGFDAVKARLADTDQSPAAVAADCGIALADLTAFYDLFAAHERTVSLFSMGANQSAQGVAKGVASRAPARSRSPASPTPWAVARPAAWPPPWPATWTSTRRSATASPASGARRTPPARRA